MGEYLDMKELGIDGKDDEDEDPEYFVGDEPFYDEEIKYATSMNSSKVKIGEGFKKENIEFDKLFSDCEALLNRKNHILKL